MDLIIKKGIFGSFFINMLVLFYLYMALVGVILSKGTAVGLVIRSDVCFDHLLWICFKCVQVHIRVYLFLYPICFLSHPSYIKQLSLFV